MERKGNIYMEKYIKEECKQKLDDLINLNSNVRLKKRDIKIIATETENFRSFTENEKAYNFIIKFTINKNYTNLRIYSTVFVDKSKGKLYFDIEIDTEDYTKDDIKEIEEYLKSVTWTIEENGSIKGTRSYGKARETIHLRETVIPRANINFDEHDVLDVNDIIEFSEFDITIGTITQEEKEMLRDIKRDTR
jgi:hypothetical protein